MKRVIGRALQGCGLGLIVCSGLLGIRLLPADAQIAIERVAFIPFPLPLPVPADSASPSPTAGPTQTPGPTPTPVPTPQPRERGGPLRFSLIGDFSFGETSTQSTFGSGGFFNTPTPSPGATATPPGVLVPPPLTNSNSQTLFGAGATAEVTRRSARSFIDLRLPFQFSGGGRSTIGVASMLFSTPHYSIGYGPQLLNGLGLLQVGSTLRGFEFIVPAGTGQATFYEGPALGIGGDTVRIQGVLVQEVRKGKFFEGGLIYGRGDNSGTIKTALFGVATSRGAVAFTGEGAMQSHSGGDGSVEHGIATQLRLDDSLAKAGCSASVRSLPNNYIIYGGGEVPSDRLVDLSCHTTKVPIYGDVSFERTGSAANGFANQRVFSFGYSPAMKFGGFSINVQKQSGSSGDVSLSSTGLSTSFSTQVARTGLLLGAQLQHSLTGGQTTDTRSILGSIHQQFGLYNVGVNAQVQRQLLSGVTTVAADETPPPLVTSTGVQRGIGFSISRTFRRTAIQFGETITNTRTETSDAIQRTPLLNLTEQISPALSISSSLGYQDLTDRLNPAVNGKSRVFSISLSAPFGYGNGLVTGRVDPNLPATIVGRVVVTGLTSGLGPALNVGSLGGSGGVGNVLVTLDGTSSQRTDLTGGFQFSFVPPGDHTISISTASIPRGFTAGSPVQTIEVKGGQQADVTFPVSTLGGVVGHVYGSQEGGVPVPLQGVRLQVDGSTYALTDAGGQFGFGGLTPGQHTVTIIPQTIPATANFPAESLKAKVDVSNGSYATLDFHAQVLGSIAGEIVFAPDMSSEQTGGVPNAYVVAEPGEHAAIDDDDGSFVIDNLPAGDYTLTLDPETIDSSLGAKPESVSVHLDPGEHYKGVQFLVGHLEKKVVFTLLGGATPPPLLPVMHLAEPRIPPKGSTLVTVSAPEGVGGVVAIVFDKHLPLQFDRERSLWAGEIVVPSGTKDGTYPVTATAGKNAPKSVNLVVDSKQPLVLVDYSPKNAREGSNVTIRARFLVEVHPGEKITWQDGEETVLGKPLSGRVYSFRKKLTLLPLHGLLLTPQGPIPIEVL